MKPISYIYISPQRGPKGLAVFLCRELDGPLMLEMGENCQNSCAFKVFVAEMLNFSRKKTIFCEIYIKFARFLGFLSLIAI